MIIGACAVGVVLLVAVLLMMAGGPTDPRLVGRWECRRGLVNVLTVNFQSNGRVAIQETDKPSVGGSWSVVRSEAGNSLIIQLPSGQRRVKFIDGDSFVMTRPDNSKVGQFQRLR